MNARQRRLIVWTLSVFGLVLALFGFASCTEPNPGDPYWDRDAFFLFMAGVAMLVAARFLSLTPNTEPPTPIRVWLARNLRKVLFAVGIVSAIAATVGGIHIYGEHQAEKREQRARAQREFAKSQPEFKACVEEEIGRYADTAKEDPVIERARRRIAEAVCLERFTDLESREK
jgi:hypothetical protein